MPHAELSPRHLRPDELDTYVELVHAAFLQDVTPEGAARDRALIDPARFHGIFDTRGVMVGGGGILSRRMTLPGTGPTPVAAVTSVGVAPGHRRRGVLGTLMRAQLHELHETGGEAIAVLWASEGGIYGRFGYGCAVEKIALTVPRGSAFRPGVAVGNARVVELPREQAMPLLRELHAKATTERVGWIDRPQESWEWWYGDTPDTRDGTTRLRFALHPEGYATYRVRHNWTDQGPRHKVHLTELVALTDQAHAALWRYLLDLDLTGEVELWNAPVDEPLVHLLADPRAARRQVSDALWVRLVDLDRALVARRYAAPLDVVLEVDDVLCPWNAGRWRVRVDTEGTAEVRRTEDDPDLALDVTDLGAVYLGGVRLTTLAAAQRVRELRPGALLAAGRAFATDRAPHCPEIF